MEDVQFLEDEITFWIKDILERDWRRLSRQVKAEGKKLSVLLHDKLTGLGLSESDIHAALREAALEGDPYKWDEEQMLTLCRCIRRIGKPIIIAANKCDKATKENIERLKALEGFKVIPTTADYELALRKASKAGLVEYEIGSGKFEILKKDALNQQQLKALEHIQEILDETWGAYYQAESEHMLRHFDEAKGYLRMCNELIDSMNLVAPPVPLFAFQWWWPAVVFVLIVAIVLFAVRSF